MPPAIASDLRPAAVQREFLAHLESGAPFVCAGDAKNDVDALLKSGHAPKIKLSLFDTRLYLTHPRQNPDLRFFVAYVVPSATPSRRKVYARIFYKDISLVWRVATHLFLEGDEMWIGKGDTKTEVRNGWEYEESDESTTDLPLEIQSELERLNQSKPVRQETAVLTQVLRRAPRGRIRAYEDFVRPRLQAMAAHQVNGGKPVVWLQRKEDPASLRVAKGFEPNFDQGAVETSRFPSKLYDGDVKRFRILSINGEIQHLFLLAPNHAWMIPPQTLETQLSSYAVRTVTVPVDEDAYVPGYEYHFFDDDSNGERQLHSQIPNGFAGEASPLDDTRVDASAWLEELPLLKQFRRYAETW